MNKIRFSYKEYVIRKWSSMVREIKKTKKDMETKYNFIDEKAKISGIKKVEMEIRGIEIALKFIKNRAEKEINVLKPLGVRVNSAYIDGNKKERVYVEIMSHKYAIGKVIFEENLYEGEIITF